MNLPAKPLWFFLTWTCILWYGTLVLYVGWRSFGEIRQMIIKLKAAARFVETDAEEK